MTPARRPRRSARSLVPLLALFAGCIDAPPESRLETPVDSLDRSVADVAPARYLTHFVFAGVDGTAFLGVFAQETAEGSLARVYRAWRADMAGWTPLAEVRDSLPVPRAAWRILPAAGFDVRVGDAREVLGLGFDTPEGRTELRAGEEVADWTGPTGQREALGLAALDVGGEAVGGLLFFRRAARALQFAAAIGSSRAFLLADSMGNGLVIEVPDEPGAAIAHTWLHGSIDAWDDMVFAADSVAAGSPATRWTFEIPGAGLTGTIRAIASPVSEPVPAFRIECDLIADGEAFRFRGLSALLELP